MLCARANAMASAHHDSCLLCPSACCPCAYYLCRLQHLVPGGRQTSVGTAGDVALQRAQDPAAKYVRGQGGHPVG
jgi:hypothetical protein